MNQKRNITRDARGMSKFKTGVQRCPATGKVCYDKKGAQTASNARYKEDHTQLRIYPCPCGFWHLTSQIKRK